MIFNNLQDFIEKVNPFIFDNERQRYKNVVKVSDAHAGIHKGCNCTKKYRAEFANNTYKNLANIIIDEEKLWLKSLFNNESIVFKDGDQEFFQIP